MSNSDIFIRTTIATIMMCMSIGIACLNYWAMSRRIRSDDLKTFKEVLVFFGNLVLYSLLGPILLIVLVEEYFTLKKQYSDDESEVH